MKTRMRVWFCTFWVLAAMGLFLSSASAEVVEDTPVVWTSTRIQSPPEIDGRIDAVWSEAVPLIVVVREAFGGGDPREVTLRALHTGDSVYVLAQWADPTESNLKDPYVWNADSNEYQRPKSPDDQFALEFPMEGEFLIDMLPSKGSYTADVWHWKAGRSNLGGWVDDKRHIISQKRLEDAEQYSMGGHNKVYLMRPMDSGEASYKVKPKPEAFEGETLGAYATQPPSGSQADIRGKGVHDGAGWTLEMTRRFKTGHADDAEIDPAKGILCAIAVLDEEPYWDHSVSQKLVLQFR